VDTANPPNSDDLDEMARVVADDDVYDTTIQGRQAIQMLLNEARETRKKLADITAAARLRKVNAMETSERVGYFIFGLVTAAAIGYAGYRFWPATATTMTKAEPLKPIPTLDSIVADGSISFEPTGDGSVYVYYSDGGKAVIWCLRGAEAVRVREIPQFIDGKPTTNPSLLPFIEHQLRQLQRASTPAGSSNSSDNGN